MNRPVFQKPEAYIRARAVPIGIVFVLCVAHRTGQRGLIYSAGFNLLCSLISARAAPAGVLCTFITCQNAPVCKQLYAHLPTCTGSYALVCRRLPVCTCPYTQGLYVLAGLHLPVYTGIVCACRFAPACIYRACTRLPICTSRYALSRPQQNSNNYYQRG